MDRYLNANIILSKFCKGYTELKRELPIRPSEMGVLNIITRREGLFTPVMIAELLDVSKPMITAHITALEKKGYVYREPSPEDKRSFYVMPTDQARELVFVTAKKMNGYLGQIEAGLGKERFEKLLETLLKTNEIMKAMEEEE